MAAKKLRATPRKAAPAKAPKPNDEQPKPRLGRPPLPPRTELARWIRARGWTVAELAAKLREVATRAGVHPDFAPPPKTLLDAVNGRHCPQVPVMLLIKHVTGGDIDLEHWHRDLYADR